MAHQKKRPLRDRWLSLLFAAALFCFIVTVSIGLPIYFRPFYYAHIDPMHLPEYSGFTKAEIKTAYDEVLDYLTIPGKPFGTGVMAHSAEGAAHFADCKVLFDLNAAVLLCSGVVLLVLWLLRRMGKTGAYRLGRRSAAFYAALSAVVLPLVSGPPMLMTRNLLYTAVTRAKRLVVIVGREGCVRAMVDNNHIARRYSALDLRLRGQR